MPIALPVKRCYYFRSPRESDTVLCWIPPEELKALSASGKIRPSVMEDFPLGLEIEVSQVAFDQIGLGLEITPDQIRREYTALFDRKQIAGSGMVDGAVIEQRVRAAASRMAGLDGHHEVLPIVGVAPEPPLSEGDTPLTVLRRLAARRRKD